MLHTLLGTTLIVDGLPALVDGWLHKPMSIFCCLCDSIEDSRCEILQKTFFLEDSTFDQLKSIGDLWAQCSG